MWFWTLRLLQFCVICCLFVCFSVCRVFWLDGIYCGNAWLFAVLVVARGACVRCCFWFIIKACDMPVWLLFVFFGCFPIICYFCFELISFTCLLVTCWCFYGVFVYCWVCLINGLVFVCCFEFVLRLVNFVGVCCVCVWLLFVFWYLYL